MTEPLDSRNVQLLVRLAELLEVSYDRGTALRHIDASRRQCAGKKNASSATFEMACERAGLRVVGFRANFEHALDRATRETPVVARARSDRDTWAVVLDRLGGKVLALLEPVGEPRWIPETELSDHLEVDPGDLNAEWYIVHAAASASAAVGPEEGQGPTPAPLDRLFAILRPDRSDLWAVGVFAIVIGALMLATPVAVQALVNFVAFGGSVAPVVVLALMLSVGLGFAAGLSALQTWIVEILQRRVFVRMVSDLSHRLPRVHRATQNHSYGPELVNRFFDVITVQKMGSFLLLDGISVALGVVLGLVVLAFYHPLLLAFDLLIVVAVLGIVYLLGPNGIQTAIRESKSKYAVASWLEDIARSPFTFRAPGAREFVLHRADELSREYINVRSRHYRVLFRQIIAMLVLQTAASVALLGIGGVLVIRGELTLGQLVASELIVTYVVGSIAKMGKHFEAYYDLMAAVDKIGNLLDLKMERTTGDTWTDMERRDPRGSHVRLERVNLTTPFGRSLFSDFDLEIEAGARLGVTGGNGSGKSTLAELLYGTLDPNRGRIEIDGLDSQSLRLEALRENVALVAGHEVFAGTVIDNVLLGRSLSTEAVHEALEQVGMLDACAALPEGVRTQITSSGMPLTESQIIRLMLARAMVGKPRLLIIDSLLDNLSSDGLTHLLQSLTSPAAPWSLVILSNRREVLDHCDRTLDLSPATPQRRAV